MDSKIHAPDQRTGQDKTRCQLQAFKDGMCDVVYSSAPKPYYYRAKK